MKHDYAHTVTTGGKLLDAYMAGFSKPTTEQKCNTERKNKREGNEVDEDVLEELICKEKTAFRGFLLSNCARVHSKAKKHQFHSTFVARYHGLSRMGSEILAQYGYLMKKDLYDTHRAMALVRSKATGYEGITTTTKKIQEHNQQK